MVITAIMAMTDIQAQNIPVGMRMEIAESEQDHAEYTIFSYKDDENTFGYYLSLGRVTHLLGLIRDDITDAAFDDIKEGCIFLGATSDEAFATLEAMIDFLDEDPETTREFQGRAATGGERLGVTSTSTCVVKKKPLGGKRLQFIFPYGERQAAVYITKSIIKELRNEFKMDKRLHPKQHR